MNNVSLREFKQAFQLASEAPAGEGKTFNYVFSSKGSLPELLEVVENSGDCDGYVSECFARRLMRV